MLTVSASAGLLVEPYMGYKLGTYESNTDKWTYNSPQLGARLGYSYLLFMAGLDYSFSTAEYKGDGTTADAGDFKNSTMGIFAGVELPILLRAWGTYYFNQKLTDEEGSESGAEYKGDGIGLGVGFTGLPFVSLNVEYRKFSYDEKEFESTKSSISNDSSEVFFSVSAPFDF